MARLGWVLVGLVVLAVGAFVLSRDRRSEPIPGVSADEGERPAVAAKAGSAAPNAGVVEAAALPRQYFPDPRSEVAGATVFADSDDFEAEIFATALAATGHVADERSIPEWALAIRSRVPRGLQPLEAEHTRLSAKKELSRTEALRLLELRRTIAYFHAYQGDFAEAQAWIRRAIESCEPAGASESEVAQLHALLGIMALRRGEVENCIACVGPSSCIFPIAAGAVHTNPEGSREAIEHFTAYLAKWPGDMRVRWLLNICYMTLGEYPQGVPEQFLIPLESFRSPHEASKFTNVALLVGITSRGPGSGGGSIFDDFNGDGRPDLFISTIDVDQSCAMFLNSGDGTFKDISHDAGLDEQVFALNVARADYDNDGDLDLLLLRGGWERPCRLSLLRNKGDATFEDVTREAGLDEPISSESASWADYDGDGDLDVFVCGEYRTNSSDPRNLSRLYRNEGNGKFTNVADEAGVENGRFAKGCAWGDYDNDGRPDLFVSNMSLGLHMPSRLYHNEGNGRFRDVAAELGIEGSHFNFSTTFVDENNDGLLDLLVCDYNVSMGELAALHMGLPVQNGSRLRLFRNQGKDGFRLVSDEVGLGKPLGAMSFNLGDIDNDGDLDMHFGTGWMAYSGLYPNITLEATETGYVDVTEATGTGHLQKGHGISFADWDFDGDLDFVVVLGGGYPGDRSYRAFFQNAGNGRNWLQVKAIGTKSNRSAIGARIQVTYTPTDGKPRTLHRVIGTNASFGGNSLTEFVGMLDAKKVDELTIHWPTTGATQVFRDINANQLIEIKEGDDAIKPRVLTPIALPTGQPPALAVSGE